MTEQEEADRIALQLLEAMVLSGKSGNELASKAYGMAWAYLAERTSQSEGESPTKEAPEASES